MPQREIGVTDQASGADVADFRTRERTVASVAVAEQYLIPVSEKVASFRGMAADFWAGNGTADTVKCAMSNLAGSTVLVALRSVVVTMAPYVTAATTAVDFKLFVQSATATGGNAVLSKVSVGTGADSAQTSNASVELRSRHGTDGGGALAVTVTLGNRAGNLLRMRPHTLAENMMSNQQDPCLALPGELVPGDAPIVLRAGQSVALVSSAAAVNYTMFTSSWLWDEYTLP